MPPVGKQAGGHHAPRGHRLPLSGARPAAICGATHCRCRWLLSLALDQLGTTKRFPNQVRTLVVARTPGATLVVIGGATTAPDAAPTSALACSLTFRPSGSICEAPGIGVVNGILTTAAVYCCHGRFTTLTWALFIAAWASVIALIGVGLSMETAKRISLRKIGQSIIALSVGAAFATGAYPACWEQAPTAPS